MFTLRAATRSLLLGGALVWSVGCQTPGRQPATAADQPGAVQPTDTVARSDGQRANAALEEDKQERAAQRRPYQPPPDRVVNQPPAGATKRR
jgi:hypothetical protein